MPWLLLLGCHGPQLHLFEDPVRITFEVMPGNGFPVDGRTYDTSAVPYAEREDFTALALREVVPDVLTTMDAAAARSAVVPGGYARQTSPSVQLTGHLADPDAVAAALGWVTWQWSVLITGEGCCETGFAAFKLTEPLTADLVHPIYLHASDQVPDLGYTVARDELVFLNLRDATGAPFSGMEDTAFVRALREVPDLRGRSMRAGRIPARLVENRWDGAAPGGEDYLARIPDDDESILGLAREEYRVLLTEEGKGWGDR